MLINSFINFNNIKFTPQVQNKRQSTYFGYNLKPLEYDTVSFGAKKKTTKEKIEELPKECFPSEDLREYMLQESSKPENKDKGFIELHKEFYLELLDCENLEESKEKYPEFQKVIDLKDRINNKSLPSVTTAIQKHAANGLTAENFTNELLKRYYGELIPARRHNADYFDMADATIMQTIKKSNMQMNPEYRKVIAGEYKAEHAKSQWLDEDFKLARGQEAKARMDKRWADSEFREAKSKSTSEQMRRQWQDPEFREKVSKKLQEAWQNPEYREKQKQRMIAQWQDEIYRETITQGIKSRAQKKWQDPEYKETMTKFLAKKRQERMQDEEFRKELSAKRTALMKKHWQDPKYRKNFRDKMQKVWQDPDFVEMQRQKMYNQWQDPAYRDRMDMVYAAKRLAWEKHPECKQAYQEVASMFPELREIFEKQDNGYTLTQAERKTLTEYHKACNTRYPEIPSLIGEEQKRILEAWGFYDTP